MPQPTTDTRLVYSQSTGRLTLDGQLLGVGYAGNGKWKNRPDAQGVKGHGPLPRGKYTLGTPRKGHTGPYSIPLAPYPTNQMQGRGDFLIHGDSILRPGTASDGCIIMARSVREAAYLPGRTLEVVAW